MNYITIINLVLAPIFILLQAFDFYSTYRVLRSGGKEKNPIMDLLFNAVGVVKGLILTKTLMGVMTLYALYFYRGTVEVTIGLTIANAIYILLVYINNSKALKNVGVF
jgi:uncharacterized protein YacL